MARAKKPTGPATFTMLWPAAVVSQLVDVVDGQPLRMVLGRGNAQTDFARFSIAPGDTLIPLHIDKGRVCPIAKMTVAFKGTVAGWLAIDPAAGLEPGSHPELKQLLVGEHGTPQHFFRPLPVEVLRALRYDAAKGPRALELDDEGRLIKHTGIDGVFRLTPESADELATIRWI